MQDQQVAIVAALFFHHVESGNAEINTAATHADDNVAGALEEDSQAGDSRNDGLVLARVGFVDAQATSGQEVERIKFEAAFRRKSEADVGVCHGNKKPSPETGRAWRALKQN